MSTALGTAVIFASMGVITVLVVLADGFRARRARRHTHAGEMPSLTMPASRPWPPRLTVIDGGRDDQEIQR